MRCPTCKRENPDDARFCADCGTRLVRTGVSEERKLVSILFCDLVDSTSLAGSRDPEEWRGTVRRYFTAVREEIERHGGTVEKFIGDAVMAVFGLPASHDDDPERAVRAGVRILRTLEGFGEITARIGITTGEVVADPAAAEKGEFLVTGDAVNLAARMQSAAVPKTIIVDARTWRNVQHVVQGRPKGALTLKGFARPVEVWEVLGVSLTAPARGLSGLRAPLMGRGEELALLDTLLQRVMRDARSSLVTIIGDAGVGKSRLLEEFRSRLPSGVRVLKGRCLPYGSDAPFSALADAIKREAGIQDTDPRDGARDKLLRFASTALGEDPDAERTRAHIVHALGLSEGESAFPITRGDVLAALSRLLASLAKREAVLVALEDVHWADDSLLDFLAALTLRPPAAHLLFICLARPVLLERRPDWGGGRRNVASIYLDPLAPDESQRLLTELLKSDLPREVATRILERAEGNPFFVEEILRMMIDEGMLVRTNGRWEVRHSELRIPDTVQGVIAARLDQLSTEEKRTAQDASVVGRIFWLQPLQRLEEGGSAVDVLARLELKELVTERPHSTIRGDQEYIFRHLLIRDVTYATIPKAQRTAKHRIVADWLVEVTSDRPDEFADLLAYHYEQAQAWREAFDYTLRLADRAYALDTYRLALGHYERADRFAQQVSLSSEDRIHFLAQRGWTYARLAEYAPALTDLDEARRLAREHGAGALEVSALLGIAWVQGHRDDYLANSETTQEALAIARRINVPRLVVDCLLDLGSCFHNLGRVHEALSAFKEASAISSTIGYERGTVHAMPGLAMQDVGQLQEAIEYHRRAAAHAHEIGERRIEAANLNYLARALIRAASAREAAEHAELVKQFSLASGDRFREQYARQHIAHSCLYLGQFGKALEEAEAALAIARALKDNEVTGYVGSTLAELFGHLGQEDSALAYEREALEAIERATTMPGKGSALGQIGTARLFRGDLAGARAAFTEAQVSRFVLWGPPEGLWGLGIVGAREGAPDEAEQHGAALEAFARPRGMYGFVARALWVRAAAARLRGKPADLSEAITLARNSGELPLLRSLLAFAGLDEAEQVAEEMARTIPDAILRESFRRTPPVGRPR